MEREHNLVPEDKLWKRHLYRIIYRSDTKLGKLFDIILLSLILISTIIIMMESVPKLDKKFHYIFIVFEWIISLFFTVEYLSRIVIVKNKRHYIFSFFGIIDFLAFAPFYLSLFIPLTKY